MNENFLDYIQACNINGKLLHLNYNSFADGPYGQANHI